MAGGSYQDVTIDGRYFSVTADTDASKKLGGFENEHLPNGDGTTRKTKLRVPWSVTGMVVAIKPSRGDQEFLQEIADKPEDVPISLTDVNGIVSKGQGTIVGELASSNQTESASFDLSGPGKLT